MQYQPLGKSSLLVSRIAFGCMSLGNDFVVNNQLLNEAFDNGINYFDTADIYAAGENEIQVGKALRSFRKQVILATKGGNQPKPGGGLHWNASKDYLIKAAEDSLRRLQTDYIDLYQLHGGTIEDPFEETLEAFEALQQQGKIRYYGISSIRPNVISRFVEHSQLVSVMMQYSLLDRRAEESCLPLLKEHQISVVARGSVAGGLLIDKAPREYLGYSAEQVETMQRAVSSVSHSGHNAAQTAIRFALHQSVITASVVGIRTASQLAEAIQTVHTPELSAAELHQLSHVLPVNTYSDHR